MYDRNKTNKKERKKEKENSSLYLPWYNPNTRTLKTKQHHSKSSQTEQSIIFCQTSQITETRDLLSVKSKNHRTVACPLFCLLFCTCTGWCNQLARGSLNVWYGWLIIRVSQQLDHRIKPIGLHLERLSLAFWFQERLGLSLCIHGPIPPHLSGVVCFRPTLAVCPPARLIVASLS